MTEKEETRLELGLEGGKGLKIVCFPGWSDQRDSGGGGRTVSGLSEQEKGPYLTVFI